MRNLVIAIVVLAVLGLGVLLLVRNSSNQKSTTSTTTNNNQTNTPAADSVTLTYTDSGFSPSSVALKAGGKLTVTNSSASLLQFNSDPHPSHTDNSELNIGGISAGQSKTVNLNNTGTWGFHNHLDSSQTGKITVQ